MRTSTIARILIFIVTLGGALPIAIVGTSVSVSAAGPCSTTGPTTTCTYTGAGEYTFSVPANVTMVHVEAVGGSGAANNGNYAAGGTGADVTADISVATGAGTLYAEVGGNAPSDGSGNPGANGGGAGTGFGGGGGGASDLRTCSVSATTCAVCPGGGTCDPLHSRLVVAGGGGGAGWTTVSGGSAGANSDGSGQAGADAVAGDGSGGRGATTSAPGAGGTSDASVPGAPGAFGQGGAAPDTVPGGGGGGYFGGGSGGADNEGGGGGGAGSSYVAPTGVLGSISANNGSTPKPPEVIISYSVLYVNGGQGSNSGDCSTSGAGACKTIGGALGKGLPDALIIIAPSTYCETIVIDRWSSLVAANSTQPTSIDGGHGGGGACASANAPDDSVVSVGDGNQTPVTASLVGLTVQNGDASSNAIDSNTGGFGGGIYIHAGAMLTLTNGIVSKNTACSLITCATNGQGGGIYDGGSLTMSGGTIVGNAADTGCVNPSVTTVCTPFGGGLAVDHNATLTDVTIDGNTADTNCNSTSGYEVVCHGAGGGVSVSGTFTLSGSTVRGNVAESACGQNCASQAGGVNNQSGTVTILGSTINANVAAANCTTSCTGNGGGMYNGSETFALSNSTVAGNTACTVAVAATNCSGNGGGVSNNAGQMVLISSTVADNTSCPASTCNQGGTGGVAADYGTELVNTIVAGNHDPNGNPDCFGTLSDDSSGGPRGSYNLIGIGSSCFSSGSTSSDLVGTTDRPINANLGPLQNNGGSLETMAPQPGSPAANFGYGPVCAAASVSTYVGGVPGPDNLDERGFSRHVTSSNTCDIGAVDAGGPPAAPTGLTALTGDGQVTVTWRGPTGAGGYAPYYYSVSWVCTAHCPNTGAAPGTRSGSTAAASSTQSFNSTVTGLTNGATYTFTVVATNVDGTGPGATVIATPAVTPQVAIAKGWNLIDVPLHDPSTGSASGVVAGVDGQLGGQPVGAVATYAHGRFTFYAPGYSADQPVTAGQGIFLLSAASGTWNPPGTAYTSGQPVTLQPGWNLVAAPYPNGTLTGGALDLEAGSACGLQEVATYGSGGYATYLAGSGATFNVPSTSGMWIECAQSYIWTPTT